MWFWSGSSTAVPSNKSQKKERVVLPSGLIWRLKPSRFKTEPQSPEKTVEASATDEDEEPAPFVPGPMNNLPSELVIEIANQIQFTQDVASLARVCRQYSGLLRPILYRHYIPRAIGDESSRRPKTMIELKFEENAQYVRSMSLCFKGAYYEGFLKLNSELPHFSNTTSLSLTTIYPATLPNVLEATAIVLVQLPKLKNLALFVAGNFNRDFNASDTDVAMKILNDGPHPPAKLKRLSLEVNELPNRQIDQLVEVLGQKGIMENVTSLCLGATHANSMSYWFDHDNPRRGWTGYKFHMPMLESLQAKAGSYLGPPSRLFTVETLLRVEELTISLSLRQHAWVTGVEPEPEISHAMKTLNHFPNVKTLHILELRTEFERRGWLIRNPEQTIEKHQKNWRERAMTFVTKAEGLERVAIWEGHGPGITNDAGLGRVYDVKRMEGCNTPILHLNEFAVIPEPSRMLSEEWARRRRSGLDVFNGSSGYVSISDLIY